MQSPIQTPIDRKETPPGLYDHMGVYGPVIWMMDWVVVCVLRMGLRAGFISPEFLMPSRPKIEKPIMFVRNRQLRRARASCFRRAQRCARKHRKLNPDDYMPRAYAAYAYIDRMDKTITPAQFREHYLRGNNISRVQLYGMDSAHEIMGFVPEVTRRIFSRMFAVFSYIWKGLNISLAAPLDPAPP